MTAIKAAETLKGRLRFGDAAQIEAVEFLKLFREAGELNEAGALECPCCEGTGQVVCDECDGDGHTITINERLDYDLKQLRETVSKAREEL